MSCDLYPWQRKLVEAISRAHQVLQDAPKVWSNLAPRDWAWTWEKIMELYRVAQVLYGKGAEESRARGKPPEEVISRADW